MKNRFAKIALVVMTLILTTPTINYAYCRLWSWQNAYPEGYYYCADYSAPYGYRYYHREWRDHDEYREHHRHHGGEHHERHGDDGWRG